MLIHTVGVRVRSVEFMMVHELYRSMLIDIVRVGARSLKFMMVHDHTREGAICNVYDGP